MNTRVFRPEQDFPAYVAFLNVALAKEERNEQKTEQEQRDFADMFGIDLEQDRFVIEHPENPQTFIAVCDLWRIQQNPSADQMLLVHPDWRRQGIGTQLFQVALEHAKAIKATAIDAYVKRHQTAAKAFVEKQGFKIAGNFIAMQASFERLPSKAKLAKEFIVRSYAELELSDEEKLSMIIKAGREFWGDLWGHKYIVEDDLAKEVVKKNYLEFFSEEEMFFFFEDSNYIGFDAVNISELSEGEKCAHVGPPALHVDWRFPQVSIAFAHVGLSYLFEKGCRTFQFSSWGESKETLDAYKALGFKETEFEIGYQLKLT